MSQIDKIHKLEVAGFNDGTPSETISYKFHKGDENKPIFIWCGGLRSDMEGGKATHLHQWAIETDLSYIRFDYYGHGISSGDFELGHIGRWSEDIISVIDKIVPQLTSHDTPDIILIGSSMGGWAALLAAKARKIQVKGMLLIAPAPDFTHELMWPSLPNHAKEEIKTNGVYYEPSPYGEPMPLTQILFEEGAKHLILNNTIKLDIPIRILQGMEDIPVPWQHALKVTEAIESEDIELTFVKSGDHSLSRDEDLVRLVKTAKELLNAVMHS